MNDEKHTWLSWFPVAKYPMHKIVRLRRWFADGVLTPSAPTIIYARDIILNLSTKEIRYKYLKQTWKVFKSTSARR